MNIIFKPSFLIFFTQSLLAQGSGASDYARAYSHDHLWPAHVTPKADIADQSGASRLRSGIPVVLIRAYEDGQLAIMDRSGSRLIDHSKTDFIQQVDAARRSDEEVNTRLLLNQLGRRTYDRSHDETKAVSEIELARYSEFLIVRSSSDAASLQNLRESLNGMQTYFKKAEIRPVMILDQQLKNQDFYELIKESGILFPVVVPVFQQGVVDAVISEREKESRVLLLKESGKLIEQFDSLEQYSKCVENPSHPSTSDSN